MNVSKIKNLAERGVVVKTSCQSGKNIRVTINRSLTEPAIFDNSITLIEALNRRHIFSSPIISLFF